MLGHEHAALHRDVRPVQRRVASGEVVAVVHGEGGGAGGQHGEADPHEGGVPLQGVQPHAQPQPVRLSQAQRVLRLEQRVLVLVRCHSAGQRPGAQQQPAVPWLKDEMPLRCQRRRRAA